jgi:hypothetical protein
VTNPAPTERYNDGSKNGWDKRAAGRKVRWTTERLEECCQKKRKRKPKGSRTSRSTQRAARFCTAAQPSSDSVVLRPRRVLWRSRPASRLEVREEETKVVQQSTTLTTRTAPGWKRRYPSTTTLHVKKHDRLPGYGPRTTHVQPSLWGCVRSHLRIQPPYPPYRLLRSFQWGASCAVARGPVLVAAPRGRGRWDTPPVLSTRTKM